MALYPKLCGGDSVTVPCSEIKDLGLSDVDSALREPHAVGACGDVPGIAVRRWDGKLRESPARGDPPDLVAELLDEPQVAVGTSGDPERTADAVGERKLGERARGREPADAAVEVVGEPEMKFEWRIRFQCSRGNRR